MQKTLSSLSLSGLLTLSVAVWLLAGCAPRVATSFWRIGTPADSVRPGYAVLHEGKKVRHCYPVTEWTAYYGVPGVNQQSVIDSRDLGAERENTYNSFHHHGVAVESELMAYRIYFDKKQTIDVYCKRTPQLELATSYWYPNDSLLADGYGDDILRVSGTVGVGTVKYWDGKLRHIENVAQRRQRIVRQTRKSATIEVADLGWQPFSTPCGEDGRGLDLVVHYTLQAGHRDMRCDVWISEPVEGLCTGVQTIPAKGQNDKSQISNIKLPNGTLLVSFGTDWPVNDTVKYAKETVGIAVFIPKQFAGEAVQDKSNNLCLLKPIASSRQTAEGCQAHFYLTCVGATKENHPVATNATEWIEYLRRWAEKF